MRRSAAWMKPGAALWPGRCALRRSSCRAGWTFPLAYGIAFASEQEIDEINILQATFLAMRRAMDQLRVRPDIALIDGNRETDFGLPVQTIVKGDSLSANIAAASILAKVTRDRFMLEMDEKYPQYGFATHKGYGTRAHYAALREFGPCPIHRRTFLKNLHAE